MKVAVIYPEVMEVARYKSKRKEFPPLGASILQLNLRDLTNPTGFKNLSGLRTLGL